MKVLSRFFSSFILCMILAPISYAQKIPPRVSIIKLIATPEALVDTRISVAGWFDGSSIWASRELADIRDKPSRVAVMSPDDEGRMLEACEGRYLVITGTVRDMLSFYEIDEITAAYDIKGKRFCWRATEAEGQ